MGGKKGNSYTIKLGAYDNLKLLLVLLCQMRAMFFGIRISRSLFHRLKPAKSSTYHLILLVIVLTASNVSPAWAEQHAPDSLNIHSSYITRLKEANRLLETWQVESGVRKLQELVAEKLEEPVAQFLLGKAYFLRGNYDEALKHLDRARAVSVLASEWESFVEFVRKTSEAAKGFNEFHSQHFRLRIKPGPDEVLITYALEALEKAYDEIGADFDFFPKEKVLIEIYPDFDSFNVASSLSKRDMEASGAIGIAKFNRIMIVSPRVSARGYRYLDTLTHEYVHYVLYRITESRATIWLQEGTAKYEETRWRQQDGGYLSPGAKSLLARALRAGKRITFDQMEPSLVKLPSAHDVQLAFAQAAMAIDYIIQVAGKEKFKRFFWLLGEGKTIPEALEEILGVNFQAFEENYWDYVKQKDFQVIPGLATEGFEFKDMTGEDGREKLLKKIESIEGQRLALLGDLLFDENRYAASIIEYKKALQAAPNEAVITIRMAKAWEYLGDWEKAEKLYLQIVDIHPGFTSAYDNLAELYITRKDVPKARQMLETSNSLNPFNPRTHELLALIYSQEGLKEKVQTELHSLQLLK